MYMTIGYWQMDKKHYYCGYVPLVRAASFDLLAGSKIPLCGDEPIHMGHVCFPSKPQFQQAIVSRDNIVRGFYCLGQKPIAQK